MIRFFERPLSATELRRAGSRLTAALDEVLKRKAWTPAELRDWQSQRLIELVHRAYASVPLYRSSYEEAGFDPAQFRGLADLTQIPVITKEALRRARRERLAPPEGFPDARYLMTSGSTGSPVGLFRSEASLYDFTAYAMLLFHDWCRGQPLARSLFILDAKPHNIDYALADLLRTTVMEERIVSTFANTAQLADLLEQFDPEYISSYPATMRNLAAYLLERNRIYPQLKLLHMTSEMLDAQTRRLINRVWPNAVLRETYTSTEAGLMGYQCDAGAGYHLAEDCVLCEIVDEHGLPAEGAGRLIITDLINDATPVIRYSGLGDVAVRGSSACACGSPLAKIASLQGRYVDSIRLEDGTLLSPYALTNIVASLEGITAYQIIQLRVDEVEVVIVPDVNTAGSQQHLARQVKAGFAAALGEDMACAVTFTDAILPPAGGHKVPLVVSKLGEV